MKGHKFIDAASILIISLFAVIDVFAVKIPVPDRAVGDGSINKTAYQIVVPQRISDDGEVVPGNIYNITRVSPENYLPNCIYIKTKNIQNLIGKPVQLSNSIMNILNNYKTSEVIAPFQNMYKQDSKKENKTLSQSIENVNRIYEVRYSDKIDPYDFCMELMKNPEIEYAVPIFIRQLHAFQPNDPAMSNQWHIPDISLSSAWDLCKGDTNVTIGIVDTGVDINHPDLKANIWTNPIDSTYNGIDEDNNGKIDDVHGWDLGNNDNNPINATDLHGTHVAGCASAVTNNSIGVASPGFKCRIIPVKAQRDGSGGITDGPMGIAYAASMGAKIINCSWGGPGYSPVDQEIIDAAVASGSLVVVSAGNDNLTNIDDIPTYPAAYNNVLTVGASSNQNNIASLTNVGTVVSVYAPGVNIYATLPNSQYGYESGTSMSSPIVAGVAALVRSFHPDWTPKQVLHQIRSTSDNVFTSDTIVRKLIYGKVNAFKALDYNYTAGKSVPGVEASKISLDNVSYVNDYNMKQLNLTITNYLGKADNLTMTIVPEGNYLSLPQSVFSLGTLDNLQSKDLQLDIQLNEQNPWYSGFIKVVLVFRSGTYTDYQLVKIPIQVTSTNKYSSIASFPYPSYTPQWLSSASSKDAMWVIGTGGVLSSNSGWFKGTQSGTITNNVLGTDQAYAVGMINNNAVSIGTGTQSNTSAYVYNTSNAGGSWAKMDVSSITGFIDDIHYYDELNGIFIGDPKTNKWGIARTTDAGTTWSRIPNIPVPLTNEGGLNSVSYFEGDNIWFGTNQGRVFYSSNRGTSWKATSLIRFTYIIGVCFKDANNGLVIYKDTAQTSPYLVARTTNGGANWQLNAYNFTLNQLTPLNLHSVPEATAVYVLCSRGEVYSTEDYGLTWKPVPSSTNGYATKGSLSLLPNNKLRMWQAGNVFGFLDFDLKTASVGQEENSYIRSLRSPYPNPCINGTNVEFYIEKNSNIMLGVYGLDGKFIKEVFRGNANEGMNSIYLNTSDLNSGSYLLNLQIDNRTFSRNFVVIK